MVSLVTFVISDPKFILEDDFEALITSFVNSNVGISDHFLNENLANNLKINLLALHSKKLLEAAGTGNNAKLVHNTSVRSDSIYWLDRGNDNRSENEFFDLIEDFIKYLNITCYTGITGYEFHYSLYEIGSFYKRHVDQFQDNPGRRYSLISYLNADWCEADGGHLLIHQLTAHTNQKISPVQGKTVFFKSNELVHEVMVTNQRRMSVTGWLKRG